MISFIGVIWLSKYTETEGKLWCQDLGEAYGDDCLVNVGFSFRVTKTFGN